MRNGGSWIAREGCFLDLKPIADANRLSFVPSLRLLDKSRADFSEGYGAAGSLEEPLLVDNDHQFRDDDSECEGSAEDIGKKQRATKGGMIRLQNRLFHKQMAWSASQFEGHEGGKEMAQKLAPSNNIFPRI